jgi:hypothetical protein
MAACRSCSTRLGREWIEMPGVVMKVLKYGETFSVMNYVMWIGMKWV